VRRRIFTIVGARPQFIKAAALSRAIKNDSFFEETLIHTGQHFDTNMSEVFFQELDIPKPKYSLDIHGGPHGQMTGRMMEAIESILIEENPDAVLVYGDTNSTLAGALVASKLHIPVIHVEAGLRSYNRTMPEEINRVLTDHISDLLFCPTQTSIENLKKEGITRGVHHVGDIMYDATLHALTRIKGDKKLEEKFASLPDRFVFMTIHREDSTASLEVFQEVIDFAEEFSVNQDLKVVFPVHPRTKKLIETLPHALNDRFILMEPLSYLETQFCLTKAQFVLTDSGGLQKEAYFHRVPCVTLRSETEWVETIEHGWNRLWTEPDYKERSMIADYGDGNGASQMIDIMKIRV